MVLPAGDRHGRGGMADDRMRYERLTDIIALAIRLQGRAEGVTLDDIQSGFWGRPPDGGADAGRRRTGVRPAGRGGERRPPETLAAAVRTGFAASSPSRRRNWARFPPPLRRSKARASVNGPESWRR